MHLKSRDAIARWISKIALSLYASISNADTLVQGGLSVRGVVGEFNDRHVSDVLQVELILDIASGSRLEPFNEVLPELLFVVPRTFF